MMSLVHGMGKITEWHENICTCIHVYFSRSYEDEEGKVAVHSWEELIEGS